MVVGWSAILPKLQADNSSGFDVGESDVTWLGENVVVVGLAQHRRPRRDPVDGPAHGGHRPVPPALRAVPPHRPPVAPAGLHALPLRPVPGPLPGQRDLHGLRVPAGDADLRAERTGAQGLPAGLRGGPGGARADGGVRDGRPAAVDAGDGSLRRPLRPALRRGLVPAGVPLLAGPQRARGGRSESLRRLRGRGANVEEELSQIVAGIKERQQATIKDQLQQFAHPHHHRPVLLLAVVFTLRELGGQYVVFSYTVYLFREAGVHLDAFLCTILVGVMRVVFTSLGCVVVDRVGRRPLVIATVLVCGAAQALGALFLLLDVPGASWVPLAAVLLFVSSYGFGLGPIPWALLGELLPTPVRFIGSSVCTFSFCLTQFVVSYLFPLLMAHAGVGVAFLVFAAAHGALGLVLWAFLPETRGRTLSDLQDCFSPARKATEQVQLQNYKKAVDS
nr:facilitated trehalose transporter Tret1-like [Penaeus vannamei]